MKNDIKEIIKKNSLGNVLAYLIAFYVVGALLFISFIALMLKGYDLYGVICLIIAIASIVVGIVIHVKAGKTDWDCLTFDVEKDFDMNLLYSDGNFAISQNYILFYSNKNIYKTNDILFYFVNNGVLRLYIRDESNNVFMYNYKYSNSNIFNNAVNVIKSRSFDSNVLYRDNYLMFSANALYDFNKICGKDVIVLRNVIELIRSNQNEFIINATYNGKNVSGVYKYNDLNMCSQTFNYICSNCNVARIYYSMEEYHQK